MYTPKLLGCAVVLMFVFSPSSLFSQSPDLGQPISSAEIAAWDINVLPDGTGLPPGQGRPEDGALIYADKCSFCHGINGEGGTNAALVGGGRITDMESQKTIANFWPYATTIFDYIRRAMPWRQPGSLTDEEVYALTAYILSLNMLIGDNDTMNAETLPRVQMPNRDGFIVRFPDRQ
jgi:mono/diheme cytochrome c family protein